MPNQAPIFTRVGDVQGGVFCNTSAADYTGLSNNNFCVFVSDTTNGGFVQRLRFKANGTNVAAVCRIFINNGNGQFASVCGTPGTPTVANAAGSGLPVATYTARVQALDAQGQPSAWSTNATPVTCAGGSMTVGWTATANAYTYRVLAGVVGGSEHAVYTVSTNTITISTLDHWVNNSIIGASDKQLLYNNYLFGEVSLPATTASTTAATAEIEYPMNVALPPGYRVLVGLGAVVAGGWWISGIGGKY